MIISTLKYRTGNLSNVKEINLLRGKRHDDTGTKCTWLMGKGQNTQHAREIEMVIKCTELVIRRHVSKS